jgi:transcriptional regulator with XRE-family HTH domain
MDLNVRLGRRVRALRKKRRLTQEQLGERAGIAAKYLGSLERGRENPTVRTLAKIAKALGVELTELFDTGDASMMTTGRSRQRHGTLRDAEKEELRRAIKVLQALVE